MPLRTDEGQAKLVRRWLAGESEEEIEKSLGYERKEGRQIHDAILRFVNNQLFTRFARSALGLSGGACRLSRFPVPREELSPVRLSRSPRRPVEDVLWWDSQGLCLFAKRLEKGRLSGRHRRMGRW